MLDTGREEVKFFYKSIDIYAVSKEGGNHEKISIDYIPGIAPYILFGLRHSA